MTRDSKNGNKPPKEAANDHEDLTATPEGRASGRAGKETEEAGKPDDWLFARKQRQERKSLDWLVEEAFMLVSNLTPTERAILELMVDGYGTQDIAEQIKLSREAIIVERRHLLEKLGAQTTTDAIRVGIYAQSRLVRGQPGQPD